MVSGLTRARSLGGGDLGIQRDPVACLRILPEVVPEISIHQSHLHHLQPHCVPSRVGSVRHWPISTHSAHLVCQGEAPRGTGGPPQSRAGGAPLRDYSSPECLHTQNAHTYMYSTHKRSNPHAHIMNMHSGHTHTLHRPHIPHIHAITHPSPEGQEVASLPAPPNA